MTSSDRDDERLPALGQPPADRQADTVPAATTGTEVDADFAGEHDKTAVSRDIITGEDTDREPESPRGWSGMQR